MANVCRIALLTWTAALTAALTAAGPARAQRQAAPPDAPAQAEGPPAEPARTAAREWDAAVGAVLQRGPAYAGARRRATGVVPGLALRWGRVSVSSRSVFAVRSSDPTMVTSGLRVDLLDSDRWRLGLGLRVDGGRVADRIPELVGLGDVRRTLRLRLGASWRLEDGWRVGAGFTVDALRRGRGPRAELIVGRDLTLTPDTHLGLGAALHLASRREMQAWFGVTPEQSARSGYAPFGAQGGLRELTLSAGLRTELGAGWAVFQGLGLTRLMGAAASSPITQQRDSWSANAGVVWQY